MQELLPILVRFGGTRSGTSFFINLDIFSLTALRRVLACALQQVAATVHSLTGLLAGSSRGLVISQSRLLSVCFIHKVLFAGPVSTLLTMIFRQFSSFLGIFKGCCVLLKSCFRSFLEESIHALVEVV